jgi:hypothetical protein
MCTSAAFSSSFKRNLIFNPTKMINRYLYVKFIENCEEFESVAELNV